MEKMPKWLRWVITATILIGFTVAFYFIGLKVEIIENILNKLGWFSYIVFVVIEVIVTTLFCFVPATTFTFTLLSVRLFGIVVGLILSIIGCFLSSIIMFLVGRYGGTRLVDWLIGKESREKMQNKISDRATVLVPIMLACPFFPDDAVVMVTGMTKMNFWYFAIMYLITRSIGITGTALMGSDATINYITEALGNNILLWGLFVNVILIDMGIIWKLSGIVENWIHKWREKKNEKNEIL